MMQKSKSCGQTKENQICFWFRDELSSFQDLWTHPLCLAIGHIKKTVEWVSKIISVTRQATQKISSVILKRIKYTFRFNFSVYNSQIVWSFCLSKTLLTEGHIHFLFKTLCFVEYGLIKEQLTRKKWFARLTRWRSLDKKIFLSYMLVISERSWKPEFWMLIFRDLSYMIKLEQLLYHYLLLHGSNLS